MTMIRHKLPYERVLRAASSLVISEIKKFSITELGNVVNAYSTILENQQIQEEAENIVLKLARSLTVNQCVHLMGSFIYAKGSEDLWNLFNMIIGRNILKVEDAQIYPILELFSKSPYPSHKIFKAFVNKIKSASLSLSENCKIFKLYGEMQIDNIEVYEIFDQKFASQADQMSYDDIVNAVIGFSNPSLNAKFASQKQLEKYLFNHMEDISLINAVKLLHNYGKIQKGKKETIMKCRDRVRDAIEEEDVEAGTLIG